MQLLGLARHRLGASLLQLLVVADVCPARDCPCPRKIAGTKVFGKLDGNHHLEAITLVASTPAWSTIEASIFEVSMSEASVRKVNMRDILPSL